MNTHFDPLRGIPVSKINNLTYNKELDCYVNCPPDDGKEIIFKFQFKKGILNKRMSGFELGQFVGKFIFALLNQNCLRNNKRAEKHLRIMAKRLLWTSKEKLDNYLPWIRSSVSEEEDDFIILRIDANDIPDKKIIVDFGK